MRVNDVGANALSQPGNEEGAEEIALARDGQGVGFDLAFGQLPKQKLVGLAREHYPVAALLQTVAEVDRHPLGAGVAPRSDDG